MKTFKMLSVLIALMLVQSVSFSQIPTFRDIASFARVNNDDLSYGAAILDVNNDGYYDLHLINDSQPHQFDHLYLNQGDGTFRDISPFSGTARPPFSNCVRVADYDNDGWQDMMVTTQNMVEFSRLYHNNGNGTFSDIFTTSGLLNFYYSACDWGDINNDGLVDLFLLSDYSAPSSSLWNSTGVGTYSLAFSLTGTFAFGCDAQFCDFDNDRDLDLLVGVYGYDRLYQNVNGVFTDIATAAGVAGSFWDFTYPVMGDFDNDGLFDIFATNFHEYENSRNCLYRQTAPLSFTNVIDSSGIDAWAEDGCGVWGDLNNDGWLDLIYLSWLTSHLWLNDGDGSFTDVAAQAGVWLDNEGTQGVALGDIDNDGSLDVYLARYDSPNRLFYNEGNNNHWLQVSLVGTVSNRLGIGARAKAVVGNLVQWRDLGGSKSQHSSNAPFIHFGLGTNQVVDSLYIYWPAGTITIMTNIPADQRINVTEGLDIAGIAPQNNMEVDDFTMLEAYPNPFNNEVNIIFEVPANGNVRLDLVNLEGKVVTNLLDAFCSTGSFSKKFNACDLSTGVYFVRLQTLDGIQIRKILLLK